MWRFSGLYEMLTLNCFEIRSETNIECLFFTRFYTYSLWAENPLPQHPRPSSVQPMAQLLSMWVECCNRSVDEIPKFSKSSKRYIKKLTWKPWKQLKWEYTTNNRAEALLLSKLMYWMGFPQFTITVLEVSQLSYTTPKIHFYFPAKELICFISFFIFSDISVGTCFERVIKSFKENLTWKSHDKIVFFLLLLCHE